MFKYFITTLFCEFNVNYVFIFLYFYISYLSIVIIINILVINYQTIKNNKRV